MTDSEVVLANPGLVSELEVEMKCGTEITVCRRFQLDGRVLWAIKHHSSTCFTKDGFWEYEPQPSSRTLEYLERARYGSLEEALRIALREAEGTYMESCQRKERG